MLLGYFDFSCEILELLSCSIVEKKNFRTLINKLAHKDLSFIKNETNMLRKYITKNDSKSFLELGKIVDSRRDFFSYHDLVANQEDEN